VAGATSTDVRWIGPRRYNFVMAKFTLAICIGGPARRRGQKVAVAASRGKGTGQGEGESGRGGGSETAGERKEPGSEIKRAPPRE
jgi:hypothetical protein